MGSRFLRELTIADVVTLGNAVIGFVAIVVAPTDPGLAARLILLGAVLDGVDGAIARTLGGSAVGPYLDSLADVPSFAIAPAVTVYVVASGSVGLLGPVELLVVAGAPAAFLAMAVLRLGFYSAYDTQETKTVGAPSTLAATILGTLLLLPRAPPELLLGVTVVLALAMIAPIDYPDLLVRDALLMGIIHVLAVVDPTFYGRVFVYALLTLASAYLVLGPLVYWGETERRLRTPAVEDDERSDSAETPEVDR